MWAGKDERGSRSGVRSLKSRFQIPLDGYRGGVCQFLVFSDALRTPPSAVALPGRTFGKPVGDATGTLGTGWEREEV